MAAQHPNDLVVVIPGIFGSQLVKQVGGKTRPVWNLSLRTLPHTLWELATSRDLVLPSAADGIRPSGLITEPAWLPDFFGVDGYSTMVDRLRSRLAPRLRTFAYDWRLSNAHTAQLFAAAAIPMIKDWRRATGDDDARLVLVCHSMGGLVARYFCEKLDGAELTRKIVTFGTPHRGALKALLALAGPKRFGVLDLSQLAWNWPSVWEMLPQYPCLLQADGSFGYLAGSSLTATSDPRFLAAKDFWAAIRDPAERRVKAAQDAARVRKDSGGPVIPVSAEACSPYQQHVFFGRVQTTVQYAERDGDAVRAIKPGQRGVEDLGGDGTVPSFSSIPIELDTTELALPLLDKHAALATRPSAIEHLLNSLSSLDVSKLKNPGATPDDFEGHGITLDVEPAVTEGERVIVDIVTPLPPPIGLDVIDHERGFTRPASAELVGEVENGHLMRADLGALAAGAYTVTTQTIRPVSDHFLVWSEARPGTEARAGQ